jgi:hypothetical protein
MSAANSILVYDTLSELSPIWVTALPVLVIV